MDLNLGKLLPNFVGRNSLVVGLGVAVYSLMLVRTEIEWAYVRLERESLKWMGFKWIVTL